MDFAWVYSWIRDPQAYHKRSRMPNLFLEAYQEGGKQIDPAADIAAFLLQKGAGEVPDARHAEERIRQHAQRTRQTQPVEAAAATADTDQDVATRKLSASASPKIKGDEIELATANGEPPTPKTGRRCGSITSAAARSRRYGCYGCHDIPNFETARPIGTTLQDWGRKDTSRLAPEHIDEYLESKRRAQRHLHA